MEVHLLCYTRLNNMASKWWLIMFAVPLASVMFASCYCGYCLTAVILVLISITFGYLLAGFLCFHPSALETRRILDDIVRRFIVRILRNQKSWQDTIKLHKEKSYNYEVRKLTRLIRRDFVSDWYKKISSDSDFPAGVEQVLRGFASTLEDRLTNIDTKRVLCDVISVVMRHLEVLNDIQLKRRVGVSTVAGQVDYYKEFKSFPFAPVHPALDSERTELLYIRSCLDCICEEAIPKNSKDCAPARLFLREVLSVNLILPLMDLLSDPDFLMMAIVAVFSKSPPEKLKKIHLTMERENEKLLAEIKKERRKLTRNTSKSVTESLTTSKSVTESLTTSKSVTESLTTSKSVTESLTTSLQTQTQDLQAAQLSVEFDPSSGAEASHDPHHVTITSHQLCEGSDGRPFIGYVIEFSSTIVNAEVLSRLSGCVGTNLYALARYTDFENLLMDILRDPTVAEHGPKIQLPEKFTLKALFTKLPLRRKTSFDPDMIESRKKILQISLKYIWRQHDLRKCEAVQKFLNTCIQKHQWENGRREDTSSATRRKSIPKVTSQVANAEESPTTCDMMGVYLHTHLPVTYCNQGDHILTDGNSKSVHELVYDSPVWLEESVGLVAAHLQHLSTADDDSLVSAKEKMSKETSESEETDGCEDVPVSASSVQKELNSKGPLYKLFSLLSQSFAYSQSNSFNQSFQSGLLTNALFCLATEAARPVCSHLWVFKGKFQQALLSLFGGAFDSGLMCLLEEVTEDEDKWARVLYHLRHTLWPNGELDISRRRTLDFTEKKQLREDAVREIKHFLPNVFPLLVGYGNYDSILQHGLDCLENPSINRNLIYTILDVLMLHLMPEIKENALINAVNKDRTCKSH